MLLFDLFESRNSKKDSDDLTGKSAADVTVARELQKLRARHPAAKSDIEALIKDEMLAQQEVDKELARDNEINQRQDELLKQLAALNIAQQRELHDVESEESALEKTLTQIQAANVDLAKKLIAMSARRTDQKASRDAIQQADKLKNIEVPSDSALSETEMQQATHNPRGPKFTGYWKGKNKKTPGSKLVGSNESAGNPLRKLK